MNSTSRYIFEIFAMYVVSYLFTEAAAKWKIIESYRKLGIDMGLLLHLIKNVVVDI
jgi:hypothetical protein